METTGVKAYESGDEKEARGQMLHHFKSCPLPQDQLLSNLGLFINSKSMARMMFMHHLYQQIVGVQGVVMDLGTRWGQNLALFSTFRGMYEPFNRHRKIIGFDTFEGFPSVCEKDGASDLMRVGNVSVTKDYEQYLDELMTLHERDNPLAHIQKYTLCKGDACTSLPKYLDENQETIIALAYFDFDLYEPTKVCLEAMKDRFVKGSVIGFDELNDADSPGETLALMEVMGLKNVRLKRLPTTSRCSYFVVE